MGASEFIERFPFPLPGTTRRGKRSRPGQTFLLPSFFRWPDKAEAILKVASQDKMVRLPFSFG